MHIYACDSRFTLAKFKCIKLGCYVCVYLCSFWNYSMLELSTYQNNFHHQIFVKVSLKGTYLPICVVLVKTMHCL